MVDGEGLSQEHVSLANSKYSYTDIADGGGMHQTALCWQSIDSLVKSTGQS